MLNVSIIQYPNSRHSSQQSSSSFSMFVVLEPKPEPPPMLLSPRVSSVSNHLQHTRKISNQHTRKISNITLTILVGQKFLYTCIIKTRNLHIIFVTYSIWNNELWNIYSLKTMKWTCSKKVVGACESILLRNILNIMVWKNSK